MKKETLVVATLFLSVLASNGANSENSRMAKERRDNLKTNPKVNIELFNLRGIKSKNRTITIDQNSNPVSTYFETSVDGQEKRHKVNRRLKQGWNLVSFPIDNVSVKGLTDRFNSERRKISNMFRYDPTKGWINLYNEESRELRDENGKLANIPPNVGVWVKADEDFEVDEVIGSMPRSSRMASLESAENIDNTFKCEVKDNVDMSQTLWSELRPPIPIEEMIWGDFIGSYDIKYHTYNVDNEPDNFYGMLSLFSDGTCEVLEYLHNRWYTDSNINFAKPTGFTDRSKCFWDYKKEKQYLWVDYETNNDQHLISASFLGDDTWFENSTPIKSDISQDKEKSHYFWLSVQDSYPEDWELVKWLDEPVNLLKEYIDINSLSQESSTIQAPNYMFTYGGYEAVVNACSGWNLRLPTFDEAVKIYKNVLMEDEFGYWVDGNIAIYNGDKYDTFEADSEFDVICVNDKFIGELE